MSQVKEKGATLSQVRLLFYFLSQVKEQKRVLNWEVFNICRKQVKTHFNLKLFKVLQSPLFLKQFKIFPDIFKNFYRTILSFKVISGAFLFNFFILVKKSFYFLKHGIFYLFKTSKLFNKKIFFRYFLFFVKYFC